MSKEKIFYLIFFALLFFIGYLAFFFKVKAEGYLKDDPDSFLLMSLYYWSRFQLLAVIIWLGAV